MSKLNHWPYPVKQSDPPLSPRETLPTMYDLPSEDPEEPGLPDEYHALQPQLLNRTFRTAIYPPEEIFTGTDLNLYYDVSHSLWYKRPDWFLVVGVPRLYDEIDLRFSYVVWQEGINPFVVVELLSPGTEKEDLGRYADTFDTVAGNVTDARLKNNGQIAKETPPTKWEVYEHLRVPYYVVFSRYNNLLRCFKLIGGHYQEQVLEPDNPRLWISELEVGLGLWQGEFEGITRQWLRWYDDQGWVPTDTEQERQEKELALERAEQEQQRAEQEQQRAEQAESQLQQVALNLLRQGMTQEQVARLTGMSELQIQKIVDECG